MGRELGDPPIETSFMARPFDPRRVANEEGGSSACHSLCRKNSGECGER